MASDAARDSRGWLAESGGRLLIDLCVIIAWVVAATITVRVTDLSLTAYYIIVFAGVLFYSIAFDPWSWRS
ncbi:hypothetical protein G6M89_05515 [Natronolimnobius sp. AArcel1]|uniref:hypothetical protein n=1 Tax=Natronolimnobius sp. AArcel1 TaxID=1679093 RepID=UPI0013EACC45|nr:hypothetical protein [Natronolimnobius sp. AArcel1]NGM68472.1 hypothetical protein [Natronolimnobius sp. AArcel1]